MRIALMVIRLILLVPYYFFGIWWHGVRKNYNFEEAYRFVQKVARHACKAGRVKLVAEGIENLPKENGFIMFPNHQGMFDTLIFLSTCDMPFTLVIKKEASNIILLKQVVAALRAHAIDREDLRQSMQVIKAMTQDVKEGRNVIIFPEGTRSKMGNTVGTFKGGSFKSATMAKCPIVPCALVDSFKPFDENSIKPVTVKVKYMEPLYYEDYKDMKTSEIAALVQERVQNEINKMLESE
ncbi:MAG: 1-acyl-sn-glycerol-3-phosphate acyltransferase [Lachnospiraceae bacterium]|nr:1-acyl-sn-glycerol-3-phosphate acyltransferase [Lachnospiraceae bacterium]